jgi:hypothetical protein
MCEEDVEIEEIWEEKGERLRKVKGRSNPCICPVDQGHGLLRRLGGSFKLTPHLPEPDMLDGTPRPRFILLVMFTNGNCHRRLFPFADHDGVQSLQEGVIAIFASCPLLAIVWSVLFNFTDMHPLYFLREELPNTEVS